jgi:hypothetical protein
MSVPLSTTPVQQRVYRFPLSWCTFGENVYHVKRYVQRQAKNAFACTRPIKERGMDVLKGAQRRGTVKEIKWL